MDELVYSKTSEIKTEGNFICDVKFKPVASMIGTALIGIGLIVLCTYLKVWAFVVFGGILLVMCALMLIFIKDFKTMSIYDKGMLVYQFKNEEEASWISYDSVREWTLKVAGNGSENLCFILTDGRMANVETFNNQRAFKELFKIMPERETKEIARRADQESRIGLKEWIGQIAKKFKKNK